MSMAIESKAHSDQDRMIDALSKLADEDPTLHISYDDETGQTIMSGMGRVAPGDHHRPDETGVQGRGQRRHAQGILPRDHKRCR